MKTVTGSAGGSVAGRDAVTKAWPGGYNAPNVVIAAALCAEQGVMSIPRNLVAAACLILTVQVFSACTNVKGSAPSSLPAPAWSAPVDFEAAAEAAVAQPPKSPRSAAVQELLVRADSRPGLKSLLGRYDRDRDGRLDEKEIAFAQGSMLRALDGEGLPEVASPPVRTASAPAPARAPARAPVSAGAGSEDQEMRQYMETRRRQEAAFRQLDSAAGAGMGRGKGGGGGRRPGGMGGRGRRR
ncbi:MAG: hypothetical protein V2A76_00655 [Planctomycetota bacterium]